MRRRRAGLPLGDAPALARAGRRAWAVRAVLAGAAAALLGAALLAAPRKSENSDAHAAVRAGTIVVLDVSSSVDQAHEAVHNALVGVMRSLGDHGTAGLVLFSNVAEEALPAGTPARELGAFLPYFRADRTSAPIPAVPDPWSAHFSLGTNISAGLAEARRMAEREGHASRVVLISDLGDSPMDLEHLRREILALVRRGIRLEARVLPGAMRSDRARFVALLGRAAVTDAAVQRSGATSQALAATASQPRLLVLLAAAAAAALAMNELLAVSLRWREERA